MNLLRVLGAIIVGLECATLIAIRIRSELDYPASALLDIAIGAVSISFFVLLVRAAPTWLICMAALISGLPILLGWLFLSVLTGIAGGK